MIRVPKEVQAMMPHQRPDQYCDDFFVGDVITFLNTVGDWSTEHMVGIPFSVLQYAIEDYRRFLDGSIPFRKQDLGFILEHLDPAVHVVPRKLHMKRYGHSRVTIVFPFGITGSGIETPKGRWTLPTFHNLPEELQADLKLLTRFWKIKKIYPTG